MQKQVATFASVSQGLLARILFGGIVVAAAVFVGLVATTASPLLVALVVGLFGGIYLLSAPRVVVWIILLAGLLGGALISMAAPQFSRITWGVVILGFLLWIPVAFSFFNFNRAKSPSFVVLSFVFLVLATFSTLLQLHSMGEFVSGFKRYFQAYGLLFALALLPFAAKDFKYWRIALAGIALAQLPFALYERFVLVATRGGFERGAAVTDVVAGTFGANLVGGSPNSLMVLFLLLAVAFAYARWREGLLSGGKTVLFAIPCLVPIFLGETKIVLLLVPLFLLILHRRDFLGRPALFLFVALASTAAVTVLAYVYILLWDRPIADVVQETMAYNFEHKGHGFNLLNRTTVLQFWWERQSLTDPVGLLFGHGIGSAYTGTLTVSLGHMAERYLGYGIDLTTASLLLWEVGLVGLALHLSIFSFAWRAAGRLTSAGSAAIRADALVIQAAIAAFVLFHFYTNSMVALLSGEIMVAVVLGYLAYLVRTEADQP